VLVLYKAIEYSSEVILKMLTLNITTISIVLS